MFSRFLKRAAGCYSALALWMVIATGHARAVAAQTGSEGTLQVGLTTSMGNAGAKVVYPLYLEGKMARDLQSLSLQLRFPAKLVKFVQAEKGFLLQGAGVELRSEVKTTGQDEESSLLLQLTSTGPGQSGIPEGLLLHLTLQLDPSTPLGAKIPLKNQAKATALREGKAVEIPVKFPDDTIPVSPRKLEDELLFGCFFYMH
ncbi:MAG: hypothetical protein HY652_12025 [Acidobacteria bacterium]|nr:hypothetical protein [Acidobacteriota bacterium]